MYDSEGTLVSSTLAVSGRPGAQNPDFQNIRNVGSIPEGTYNFSTHDEAWWRRDANVIQVRDDEPWSSGWGNFRVALHPEEGTNTFGRHSMYIHGGDVAGSAGCIDLVGGNDSWSE